VPGRPHSMVGLATCAGPRPRSGRAGPCCTPSCSRPRTCARHVPAAAGRLRGELADDAEPHEGAGAHRPVVGAAHAVPDPCVAGRQPRLAAAPLSSVQRPGQAGARADASAKRSSLPRSAGGSAVRAPSPGGGCLRACREVAFPAAQGARPCEPQAPGAGASEPAGQRVPTRVDAPHRHVLWDGHAALHLGWLTPQRQQAPRLAQRRSHLIHHAARGACAAAQRGTAQSGTLPLAGPPPCHPRPVSARTPGAPRCLDQAHACTRSFPHTHSLARVHPTHQTSARMHTQTHTHTHDQVLQRLAEQRQLAAIQRHFVSSGQSAQSRHLDCRRGADTLALGYGCERARSRRGGALWHFAKKPPPPPPWPSQWQPRRPSSAAAAAAAAAVQEQEQEAGSRGRRRGHVPEETSMAMSTSPGCTPHSCISTTSPPAT
jgi:hypothetical protein